VARRVFWLGGLFSAVVSVGFFAILLTGVLGERGTVIVDDYLCWVVPVLAGLACVRRGWRQATDTADRRRSGWVLMGISCLSWGGGGLIWTIYEVHLGQEVPYPSLADVGYLLAVPPAIVGLGLLSGAGRGLSVRLRDVADGAVAGTALLFISWATVLGPLFADNGSGLLSHAIGLAYPTSDVLTATVALLAVARARGTHRTVMTLLGLGLAAVAVSDSSFTWFTSQGSYATGNLFDTGYVVGYLLIALAALHPGGALTGGSHDQPSRVAMALPYVPIFAVGVVGAVLNLAYRPLGPFLYWDGAAMLALIMGRQLLSLSANQSLSRQLQDTITTLQEREHELAHRAFHDDLTGLPNRAMFHELLTSELLEPERHRVIVMLIDLDDFKLVNDTHGHHVGDALLAEVAQRLRGSLRGRDIVARLGGDEFAVLLRDEPTPTTADTVARRIRESLREPLHLPDESVSIRASIGISYSDDGSNLNQLLCHADAAMYRAKRDGKESRLHPSASGRIR
jgi:diguanylate cyclase